MAGFRTDCPYGVTRRASVFDGHGECRCGQLLSHAAPHPPGNDPTRVENEHHREIEPALSYPDVRDVARPTQLGFATANSRLSVLARRNTDTPNPWWPATSSQSWRESGLHTSVEQYGVGSPTGPGPGGSCEPVDSTRPRLDHMNLGDQPSIFCRAETLGPGHPSIVTRWGHRQDATHHSRTWTRPVCARMAWHLMTTAWRSTPPHFFKNSRSCVTRAKSRLSRASSSLWGLRLPLPGKAPTGSLATLCFKRRIRFGLITRSRATWEVGCRRSSQVSQPLARTPE